MDEIMAQAPMASEFSDMDEDKDENLKLFIPDNLQFAIFNGAAVLGGVLSFQVMFVTSQQFQSDSGLLYRDISQILR